VFKLEAVVLNATAQGTPDVPPKVSPPPPGTPQTALPPNYFQPRWVGVPTTVILDPAAIQIGMQCHRLAHTDVAQLSLFEVGVHPDVIERHQPHERCARGNALSDLNRALDDDAGDRRTQLRAMQCQRGIAHGRLGIKHLRMSLNRGARNLRLGGIELLTGRIQCGARRCQRIADMRQLFAGHGVDVLTGTTVRQISRAATGEPGRLRVDATTAGGQAIMRLADLVLVVVGVRPA